MSPRIAVETVEAALGRTVAGPAPVDGFVGVSIDSRRLQTGALFVALRGERFDGNDFVREAIAAGATGVVSADNDFEARERIAFWPAPDGVRALQEIASRHRDLTGCRIVGITGSNGKSTTKELVAAVLSNRFETMATRGNLNNQIGVPLTLLELEQGTEWGVIEMGTSEPGEISTLAAIAPPDLAIITGVAASHLEGLGTIEAVLDEKMALARALPPHGVLFYNGDQPILTEAVRGLGCRAVSYGLDPENDIAPDSWSIDSDGRGTFEWRHRTFRLRLVGTHNILNALAAVAVGTHLRMSPGAIAMGVAEPGGLPLRMQLERWGAVVALVDCYNANPDSVVSAASTLSALEGEGRRIAVLGEMRELGSESVALHGEVGREVAALGIDVVVAVGDAAAPIADGATRAGARAIRLEDRASAARWLIENLEPEDRVLFKASRGARLEDVVEKVRESCLGCVI